MKSLKDLKELNIKQLINEQRLFIIWAFFIICILFADYKLFFRPIFKSIKVTTPQVRDLQIRLDNAQRAASLIPTYESQIQQLQNRLSPYNVKFSTKQQIASLLESLSVMANTSGVKITSVKPHAVVAPAQGEESGSLYQKFPISIKAECGYHQLGTFLNKLENADTFMRVTDIRIDADPKGAMEHIVYLLVNTYVLTHNS